MDNSSGDGSGSEEIVYADLLKKLTDKTEVPSKFDPQQHKDETRSTIALIFTVCYFSLILIVLLGTPFYNHYFKDVDPVNIKDALLAISSIVGGPFGFVVGYYFKGSEH